MNASETSLGSKYETGYRSKSPISGGTGVNKHTNMFQAPQWRDLWAAILFYIHFFGFIGISVYAFVQSDFLSTPVKGGKGDLNLLVPALASLGGGAGTAILLTVFSMMAMYFAPMFMLQASFITSIVLNAAMTLLSFINGNILGGILFGLSAIVSLLFYIYARDRFSFSAILLKTVVDVLKTYPAMLSVSFGSVFLSIPYFTYVVATLGALSVLSRQDDPDPLATPMIIYVVFSLFWTSQVVGNVVQTTVAGVYATYYFLFGTGQAIRNPTASSLRRSLSYNFGSICFGSLIVATIQLVRFLIRTATDKDSIVGAIADCCMGVLENLARYFNYYAYTQVAIYGKPFIEAAKDTFQLVKSRGVDAIINDSLVSTCINLTALTIAIASGLVSFAIANLFFRQPFEVAAALGVTFGFMGMLIPLVAFEIIGAGVTTTFVCLAEDPQALQRSKPDLYNEIATTYAQIFI